MPPLHGVHTAAFRDEAAGAPKGGLKLISCAMLRAPHTPDVVCSLDASGQALRPNSEGRSATAGWSRVPSLRASPPVFSLSLGSWAKF